MCEVSSRNTGKDEEEVELAKDIREEKKMFCCCGFGFLRLLVASSNEASRDIPE